MSKLATIMTVLLLTTSSYAAGKFKCKESYKEVSCSDIKESKRSKFCWKGELATTKKEKICKTVKKKKSKKLALNQL